MDKNNPALDEFLQEISKLTDEAAEIFLKEVIKFRSKDMLDIKTNLPDRPSRKSPYDYTDEWKKIAQESRAKLSPEERAEYDELSARLNYEAIWKHKGFQYWLKNNFPRTHSVSMDEKFDQAWQKQDPEGFRKAQEKERNSIKTLVRNLLT